MFSCKGRQSNRDILQDWSTYQTKTRVTGVNRQGGSQFGSYQTYGIYKGMFH